MDIRSRSILALACATLLPLVACSDEPPAAPPESAPPEVSAPDTPDAPPAPADPQVVSADPFVELGVLWRRISADPEAADPADVDLVNALIQELVLPDVEEGQWQVESVLAAPTSDFHAELASGARKLFTLELRHRGDLTEAERNAFGDQSLKGYPCSRRARFLFVLAGNIELRATGEDPAFRSADSLEPILARFPLDELAKL